MSEHYFSTTPTSASQTRSVRLRARGVVRDVWTDNGVFSKGELDGGSRLLIETVRLPSEGCAVDLGCGYGAVSAILSRVYTGVRFVLLDVNERAVALARRNLNLEGPRVEIHLSDGFSAVPDVRADAVLLNPPIRAGKQVVYRLFREAGAHLREDGALWIVMHKKHGAESARNELAQLFCGVELVDRNAGFHVSRCTQFRERG